MDLDETAPAPKEQADLGLQCLSKRLLMTKADDIFVIEGLICYYHH